MNAELFRKLALKQLEATEGGHQDHRDFRVAGKVFATLGPDGDWGMVKLRPDQQTSYMKLEPASYEPFAGAWGQRGYTRIALDGAQAKRVAEALRAAWRNTAPKRLIAKDEEE